MKKFIMPLLMLPLIGIGCARGSGEGAPSLGEPAPSDEVIEYRDGVFTPAELRIPVGTTVTFKNVGSQSVWPASGIHPTHLLCAGFDARRPLGPREIYTFTFEAAKTCPYHNHISATEFGRIIVE
ncbi:hypothetical protein HY478_03910 [Candidatus Uhrbacteria bacterium]|nr:hypothetical protein [Candidatus Uhrbacteria bacterium]